MSIPAKVLIPCVATLLLVAASLAASAQTPPAYVELKPANFQQEIEGKAVDLYTIRNKSGMTVRITNYGARIEQILVPDRDGRLGDVVLGYETIGQVLTGQGSMGAFMGRFTGRIAHGKFTLDGHEYQLPLNEGQNSLHGGIKGSRFHVFDARQLAANSLQLTYVFKDGEEGYPGTLPVRVTYTVTDDNALILAYEAVAADKATVVNFTGHTFFNLSGDPHNNVLGYIATINADHVLMINPTFIPTGAKRAVEGTPMDFRQPKAIGRDIDKDYDLLKLTKGYDHTYVINQANPGELTFQTRVEDPASGRVLEVWSTEPGLQFYTANTLSGQVPRDVGKGGIAYLSRTGLCLEPLHYSDAPNKPGFPSTELRPGEWYTGQIAYRFSTEQAGK